MTVPAAAEATRTLAGLINLVAAAGADWYADDLAADTATAALTDHETAADAAGAVASPLAYEAGRLLAQARADAIAAASARTRFVATATIALEFTDDHPLRRSDVDAATVTLLNSTAGPARVVPATVAVLAVGLPASPGGRVDGAAHDCRTLADTGLADTAARLHLVVDGAARSHALRTGHPRWVVVADEAAGVVHLTPRAGWATTPAAADPDWSCGRHVGDGTAASAEWGGHSNGRIGDEHLCPLTGRPHHRLRCDAAYAFDALSAAHELRFGTPLCLTDSYRSFDAQVALRAAKPTLAAVPGTSRHGWGLAVDVCRPDGSGIDFDTPTYRWLTEHAPRYGWQHPEWARVDGSVPEPWHWEYGNLS